MITQILSTGVLFIVMVALLNLVIAVFNIDIKTIIALLVVLVAHFVGVAAASK